MGASMADLNYTPTEPPATPFAVGEQVCVYDRNGCILSERTVTKATANRVTTSCGRRWTQQGEWFDGKKSWPFPSISKADAAGVALPLEGLDG